MQYELAATTATDPVRKAELNASAARHFIEANEKGRADRALSDVRDAFRDGSIKEETLLEGLLAVAVFQKDIDNELALMERIVELCPNDFDRRFSLAFKHAENNNEELGLYHYIKIPIRERDAAAWNNLGVSLDHFKIPGKAVNAFKQSEEKGNSLAMANLGFKSLTAGLVTEAKIYCEKALGIENYHKNVGQLLAQITELPDEETKKQAEVVDKAKLKADYYERFGHALTLPTPTTLDGIWTGPECSLKLESSDKRLIMTGQFQTEINSLLRALGGGEGRHTYSVKYSGQFEGGAIKAELTKKLVSGLSTSLLDGVPTKVLMYFDSKNDEIRVVENPSSVTPRFYSLNRAIVVVPA